MLDLTAAGPKILAGSGGGTSAADPFSQATTNTVLETAVGAIADAAWSGSGNGTAIAILKAIVVALGSGGNTPVDGSGTVTTGGVAQTLFGGVTPAMGYMVQNLSAGDLYINDLGTASAGAGSILIPSQGSMFISPSNYRPPGAVSLFGATTAQAFSARHW